MADKVRAATAARVPATATRLRVGRATAEAFIGGSLSVYVTEVDVALRQAVSDRKNLAHNKLVHKLNGGECIVASGREAPVRNALT
ncbi:hypothetical protein GCM10010220_67520 [Streptomyces parvulus]|nr:hypothetical protein GCM10010220_67520 [Streptomyces parvulus]